MGELIDYLGISSKLAIGTSCVISHLPMTTFFSAVRLRELSKFISRPCSLRHRLNHNTLGSKSFSLGQPGSKMLDAPYSNTDPKLASQEPQNASETQGQQNQGDSGSSKEQIEALFRAARERNAKLTPEEIQKQYPWSRSPLSPEVCLLI